MSAVADTIISSTLWILFGHNSQSFDWLGIINDFQVNDQLANCLIFMPVFRWMGDCVYRISDAVRSDTLLNNTIPSPLCLTTLVKSVTTSPNKFQSFIIYTTFTLQSASKIADFIWRFYALRINASIGTYTIGISSIDSIIFIFGAINYVTCCYFIYQNTLPINLKSNSSGNVIRYGLEMIKSSCFTRLLILASIKIIFVLFFVGDSSQAACTYDFLKPISTKLVYQFYYFDYLISKSSGSKMLSKISGKSEKSEKMKTIEKNTIQMNNEDTTKKVQTIE
ncbi:hypothetical protein HDV02_003382 [Globomyces sp. JEL0801]|nr:hypothetical protein HDV02_003382 [Globomyces sp. JEL0801]